MTNALPSIRLAGLLAATVALLACGEDARGPSSDTSTGPEDTTGGDTAPTPDTGSGLLDIPRPDGTADTA